MDDDEWLDTTVATSIPFPKKGDSTYGSTPADIGSCESHGTSPLASGASSPSNPSRKNSSINQSDHVLVELAKSPLLASATSFLSSAGLLDSKVVPVDASGSSRGRTDENTVSPISEKIPVSSPKSEDSKNTSLRQRRPYLPEETVQLDSLASSVPPVSQNASIPQPTTPTSKPKISSASTSSLGSSNTSSITPKFQRSASLGGPTDGTKSKNAALVNSAPAAVTIKNFEDLGTNMQSTFSFVNQHLKRMGSDILESLKKPGIILDDTLSEQDEVVSPVESEKDELQEPSLHVQFSLPMSEEYITDFSCAIQRKILVQGRLYVFTNYICFKSTLASVFGYDISERILLDEVVGMVKATTVMFFANAIEIITTRDKYFFGSFMYRDDAFQALLSAWEAAKRRQSPNDDGLDGCNEGLMSDSTDVEMESMAVQQNDPPRPPLDLTSLLWSDRRVPVAGKDIANTTVPLSAREFFTMFFSDESKFVEDYHIICGHSEISSTPWTPHPEFGFQREVQYRTPIKGQAFGPKSTRVHETQYYRFISEDHLIVSTSAWNEDIPFADSFTMETLWNISPIVLSAKQKKALFETTSLHHTTSTRPVHHQKDLEFRPHTAPPAISPSNPPSPRDSSGPHLLSTPSSEISRDPPALLPRSSSLQESLNPHPPSRQPSPPLSNTESSTPCPSPPPPSTPTSKKPPSENGKVPAANSSTSTKRPSLEREHPQPQLQQQALPSPAINSKKTSPCDQSSQLSSTTTPVKSSSDSLPLKKPVSEPPPPPSPRSSSSTTSAVTKSPSTEPIHSSSAVKKSPVGGTEQQQSFKPATEQFPKAAEQSVKPPEHHSLKATEQHSTIKSAEHQSSLKATDQSLKAPAAGDQTTPTLFKAPEPLFRFASSSSPPPPRATELVHPPQPYQSQSVRVHIALDITWKKSNFFKGKIEESVYRSTKETYDLFIKEVKTRVAARLGTTIQHMEEAAAALEPLARGSTPAIRPIPINSSQAAQGRTGTPKVSHGSAPVSSNTTTASQSARGVDLVHPRAEKFSPSLFGKLLVAIGSASKGEILLLVLLLAGLFVWPWLIHAGMSGRVSAMERKIERMEIDGLMTGRSNRGMLSRDSPMVVPTVDEWRDVVSRLRETLERDFSSLVGGDADNALFKAAHNELRNLLRHLELTGEDVIQLHLRMKSTLLADTGWFSQKKGRKS